MKILAIDLGETTGYALVKHYISGVPLRPFALLSHGTCRLGGMMPDYGPDLVVIERPAYIGAGAKIQEEYSDAVSYYRRVFSNIKVVVVKPADWMPRFNHYPLPGRGMLPTQHEKDAYRMAAWAHEKFA